jgi:anti-sigma B factor antagonist
MSDTQHDTFPPLAPAGSRLEPPPKTEPFRILLSPALIVANRHVLKQHVVDAIAEGFRDVIVDARECGYIDTSGLGVLVSCSRKCRDAGGALVLAGLSDELFEYLRVIRFDTIFTLERAQ